MFRQDWLLRLIEQLAEFVGRIAGSTARRDWVGALDEAGRAWDELLGMPRELVDRLDSPTLASMLREPAKMRVGAELSIAEAKAYAGKGDPLHAGLAYRRAFELYLEARALEPLDSDDASLLELSRMVPPGEVDPRYKTT